MKHVIYKFEIPDKTRPILEESYFGPSGELIPFTPAPLDPETAIGRTIDEICPSAGTYGMGGPGFFGLRLGRDWLIISIWGAGNWIFVDDRLVMDIRHEQYERPLPWIDSSSDRLTPHLVGAQISAIEVNKHSLTIQFSNKSVLVIDPDPSRRPIREGNKKPRAFAKNDDLRRAVFLSPTIEIWV